MIDRNTVVGIDFLVVGITISALGYIFAQSISIAAFGLDLAIIGALVILIVPESVPQDAYKALLKDSISNIEVILEESMLKERAYFIPTADQKVRAMIPLSSATASVSENPSSATLIQSVSKAPVRFISRYGGLDGLFLYPPGNEIVHLSKVSQDDDLEVAVRHAIIELSDLASSVVVLEDKGSKIIKVQISKPKLASDSPFFNESLGSPVSCVACCVITAVKGLPVRITDEKVDRGLIRLTLQVIE